MGSKSRRTVEIERALDEALAVHRDGRTEQAIAGYRAVLARDRDNLTAHMNLGNALTTVGRPGEAIVHLRRAVALAPRNAEVLTDAGLALIEVGSWAGAIAWLARAVEADATSTKALLLLGRASREAGRRDEAIAALRRVVAMDPLSTDAWVELCFATFDDRSPMPSLEAATRAVATDASAVSARFHLGVLLELTGKSPDSHAHLARLHADPAVYAGARDSLAYAIAHRTAATRFFSGTRETLHHACDAATVDGLVLELGVRYGVTARYLAEKTSGTVHGFDSFQGLPEDWHAQSRGAYSTHGALPEVPPSVELHVGLFDDTLPPMLAKHAGPVRLVNVDCDLYSSTRTALTLLADRLVPGSVLVFDEYLVNDRWREDEYKAFRELVEERALRYEYLAFNLVTGQAVVRMS